MSYTVKTYTYGDAEVLEIEQHTRYLSVIEVRYFWYVRCGGEWEYAYTREAIDKWLLDKPIQLVDPVEEGQSAYIDKHYIPKARDAGEWQIGQAG